MGINFVVNVYRDERYARPLLEQVKKFYPGSVVLVIADGHEPSVEFTSWVIAQRFHYVHGDRLKRRAYGGAWVERFLRLGTTGHPDWLIKLDADAMLHRPFRYMPPAGDIAGTLVTHSTNGLTLVRGGCVAYSRDAIAKILNSQLLKDDLYKTAPRFCYRRYQDYVLPGEQVSGEAIASEDAIVADVAVKLGLTLVPWHEVHICWREDLPVAPADFWACTHPYRPDVGIGLKAS